MAELLVLDRTDSPATSLWQRGDVVVIQPDGFEWGLMEGPPSFKVVKVPGPVSDFAYLLEEWIDGVDADGGDVNTAHRRFAFDPTKVRHDSRLSLARVTKDAARKPGA